MKFSNNLYLSLAWRNIWRNKRRTLITMSSVVFAVVLAVCLNSVKEGILVKMQENAVSFYTGAIQIQDSKYWDEKTLDNSFVFIDSIDQILAANEEINHYAPRLESFALAASDERSKGTMVVGVDPDKESALTALNDKVIEGKYFKAEDKGIIISSGLAKYLDLNVNDTLILIGQGYHGVSAAGKYPIQGMVKMGSPELNKRLVYLPLSLAQNLFGAEERVSSIVINPHNVNDAEIISAKLKGKLSNYAVLNWKELLPELDQMLEAERAENVIFLFVLYLLISFGIFGTILMMLMERQFEFGALVAIGMRPFNLSNIIILENIFISVLGAIIGTLISIPVILYFYKFPVEVGGQLKEAYENYGFEPVFYFSVEPEIFYSQTLVVFCIALVLSLYPILKILRLNPIEAMRN